MMTNEQIVLDIFNQWYIDMIGDVELINDLRLFESEFKDIDIWFRFFKDDTLATDINDIERDLTNSNRTYRAECIKMALDDNTGFQLNFDTYKRD
jgi:hypothetical protein